jgi:glucose-1-phosphate thymidylyltransferase
MKAIITAGGRGTRMQPLTFSTNKHFIPLANQPLIFYAIEEVVEAGIKEIGINYNPGQLEEIKSYLGKGEKWGVKFSYILQEKPAGLAHIIQVSEPFVKKERFLMHNGDNIFHGGIEPLVDWFLKHKPNALAPIVHHKENWRLGVPFFDKKGRLVKYVEKPKKPPHDFAVPGLYFFDHYVFKCFKGKKAIKPSPRGELEISSVYQWLINNDYQVETKEFRGVWKDPGKFDDWLDTNQFLLDADLKQGSKSKLGDDVKIEGRVQIGRECQIKNSSFRGPAIIGDKVTIIDSFIGPYSSIGDECQIINAKVENTILVKAVQVKDLSKPLDSSLIGEGTVIEGNDRPSNDIGLFVGNQCVLKL